MADAVEAGADIPFQDPARSVGMPQGLETMLQGIRAAAFQSEAIGMAIRQGFRDGIQAQQVQSLHGSIGHRGDPQGPLLAVAFWDVHPA